MSDWAYRGGDLVDKRRPKVDFNAKVSELSSRRRAGTSRSLLLALASSPAIPSTSACTRKTAHEPSPDAHVRCRRQQRPRAAVRQGLDQPGETTQGAGLSWAAAVEVIDLSARSRWPSDPPLEELVVLGLTLGCSPVVLLYPPARTDIHFNRRTSR
jgi:hypothetical protein